MSSDFKTNVKRCARCGGDHAGLMFLKLDNGTRYSHFAICPTVQQPIMMMTLDDTLQAGAATLSPVKWVPNCEHCGNKPFSDDTLREAARASS